MRENQIYILPRVVRPDVQNNLCTLRTCGNKWSTDVTQGIELGHSQWVGGENEPYAIYRRDKRG